MLYMSRAGYNPGGFVQASDDKDALAAARDARRLSEWGYMKAQ